LSDFERVPTGIDGLDELMEGGLPKGRSTLVCGGPGTGKTIFAIQFLYNGVKMFDESGLFVTLSDRPDCIGREMLRFGWNLEELDKQGRLTLLDLSDVVYLSREAFRKAALGADKAKMTIEAVAEAIRSKASKADRIVIDCVTSLMVQQPDQAESRREVAYLLRSVLEMGCTCLVTSETQAGPVEFFSPREFQVEEYLAQGVIVLRDVVKADTLTRAIQVHKMRGTAQDREPHPYRITEKGIVVFPTEKVL